MTTRRAAPQVILAVILAVCSRALAQSVELQELLREQDDCITTPAAFKAAWEAREPRCVSEQLVGRVISAKQADKLEEDTEAKLAYFWSGADALAKYLRIGRPQTLGYSIPDDPAGLASGSSGFAFMRQVGYSDLYLDVGKVYQLRVTTKARLAEAAGELAASGRLGALNGGVPPLQPTWPAVAAYFEHAFANLSQPLELPPEAVDLLDSASFAELTGCPAYCTYGVGFAFPSANQTVPVVTQARDGGEKGRACPLPSVGTVRSTAEELDAASPQCDKDWQEALASAKSWFPSWGCENSSDAGTALGAAVADAGGDPRRQALLFRAFLLQFCAGGFYGPFSGTGLTYSGLGGILAPVGVEFISSPFAFDAAAWEEDGSLVALDLCLTGIDGSFPSGPNGTCPLPPARGADPVAAAAAAPSGARRLLRG